MNISQLVWFTPLFFLLASCGHGLTPPALMSGVSGAEIVLKFNDGYHTVSGGEIQSLTVSIQPTPPSAQAPLVKTFFGESMKTIFSTLALHRPSEPASAGAIVSGTIVLRFKSAGTADRTLNILNARLLEDTTYRETYYYPSQLLTQEWLSQQLG